MNVASKKALDFVTYQCEALTTDQMKDESETSFMVPLLGLVGEVGTLAVEHKKKLRDKEKHRLFKERIEEDLGDILWYVANFASKSELDLEQIARRNLEKVRSRWALPAGTQIPLFDEKVKKAGERIPRHFAIEFKVDAQGRVVLTRDGKKLGDALTDNNYGDDGYRFHDVFHLAYAAVLGWSPVSRGLLKCKRKSVPLADEVEDGGRAAVIEEGVSALVYAYARSRDFLDGATEVDHDIIDMARKMTAHLEVRARTDAEWAHAILVGFKIWRQVRAAGGGRVTVDLEKRDSVLCEFANSQECYFETGDGREGREKKGGLRSDEAKASWPGHHARCLSLRLLAVRCAVQKPNGRVFEPDAYRHQNVRRDPWFAAVAVCCSTKVCWPTDATQVRARDHQTSPRRSCRFFDCRRT
ncbi:MAG: nucleoside triphosphate pyrophosphohydrolase family protein [Polyangiaceae bacterium]